LALLSTIIGAGRISVAAGSHESKMCAIEAKLTSGEVKVKVCEYTACTCLCGLGGVSQTAGLALSGSQSVGSCCLVSEEESCWPPPGVPIKQLEACQDLQGRDHKCSFSNRRGREVKSTL